MLLGLGARRGGGGAPGAAAAALARESAACACVITALCAALALAPIWLLRAATLATCAPGFVGLLLLLLAAATVIFLRLPLAWHASTFVDAADADDALLRGAAWDDDEPDTEPDEPRDDEFEPGAGML